MTAALIVLNGQAIPLTDDGTGLVGRAEIDGRPVVVHATVTTTGRRALTPAQWCASN